VKLLVEFPESVRGTRSRSEVPIETSRPMVISSEGRQMTQTHRTTLLCDHDSCASRKPLLPLLQFLTKQVHSPPSLVVVAPFCSHPSLRQVGLSGPSNNSVRGYYPTSLARVVS
jgi:hypothetical protein